MLRLSENPSKLPKGILKKTSSRKQSFSLLEPGPSTKKARSIISQKYFDMNWNFGLLMGGKSVTKTQVPPPGAKCKQNNQC